MADKKEAILIEMLRAREAAYTPEQLRQLWLRCDDDTLTAIYDILCKKPVAEVLREWSERRLEPAARDVLVMIDQDSFVSSAEVMDRFGIMPSTASNRLTALVRVGLARRAFAYIPSGGGKRYYFSRVEQEHSKEAIQTFVGKLGGGAYSSDGN